MALRVLQCPPGLCHVNLCFPMAEFSPLEVSAWIKKHGPSFKEAIFPFSLYCIFHIIKSRWMNLSFVLLPTIGSLLSMFFNSMVYRYAPLLRSLMQSWVNEHVFPTMGGDLPTLVQALLGAPLEKAKLWCVFGKLNIHLIFTHFS